MATMEKTETGMESSPAIITERDLAGLPSPVKKWLKQSGIIGKERLTTAWFAQESKMKLKPEQEEWYTAKSEQVFRIDDPAFHWKVRVKMGMLGVRGSDSYEAGKGRMKMKLLSLIPVVNAGGPKIDEASLQRYMSELIWFPQAAVESWITWEAMDETRVRALIEVHGQKVEGVFTFNETGDFVQFETMRYKGNEDDSERLPWMIRATAYSTFDGVRIPSTGEVTWKEANGDWTWLSMKIIEAKYNY